MSKWLGRTVLVSPFLKLCTTEAQYLKAAKTMGVTNPLAWLGPNANASMHSFTQGAKTACIVCMPIDKKRSFNEVAGMLAHEAVHVKQDMFADIGEDKPGSEVEAYAVQNILFQLLESYQKQAKKA